jgi:serine/threonine protein phosphatase PrpC
MLTTAEPLPDLQVLGAGSTDPGRRRRLNEDRIAVRDDLLLYLVCDGAGGHNAGEVAAALAARSIVNYLAATSHEAANLPEFDRFGIPYGARRISAAVHKANRDVAEISRTSHQHKGMGTTVVAILFTPRSGLMHVAHVGDSRCYRLRSRHLELMTQDHSLLTDVLEYRPDLDDTKLDRIPRNIITRALGVTDELRVSVRSHPVVTGDRYLLCSDGLSGPVPGPFMSELLRLPESGERVAQHLILAANAAGGPDNISAVIVDCSTGPDTALPLGPTEPPPPPDVDEENDPELLILGSEEIDLDDHSSNLFVNALTEVYGRK